MVAATFEAVTPTLALVTVTSPVPLSAKASVGGATESVASGVAVTVTVTGVAAVLVPAIDTLVDSTAGAVSVIWHDAPRARTAPQVVLCTVQPLPPGMVAAGASAGTGEPASAVTVSTPVPPSTKDSGDGVTSISAVASSTRSRQMASTSTVHESPGSIVRPTAHSVPLDPVGAGSGSSRPVGKQASKSGSTMLAMRSGTPVVFSKATR